MSSVVLAQSKSFVVFLFDCANYHFHVDTRGTQPVPGRERNNVITVPSCPSVRSPMKYIARAVFVGVVRVVRNVEKSRVKG